MKLRCVPAAEVDAAVFIRGANAAFGSWGDEALFDWAFRRGPRVRPADLLLLDDRGRTVAGSGITYRTLRHALGGTRLAAIMTGSWTLPEQRGRGAFTTMITATCDVAQAIGAVVLGFGRMENASRRRLDAAGAALHPAFYCRSTRAPEPSAPLDRLEVDPESFATRAGSTFLYAPDEWRLQFVDRPGAHIECLGRRGQWAAIVESAGDSDRVHALSDVAALPVLASRAHARGRRLFCYTTVPAVARELAALGFECTDGFLATLPGSPLSDWSFQNGDRM